MSTVSDTCVSCSNSNDDRDLKFNFTPIGTYLYQRAEVKSDFVIRVITLIRVVDGCPTLLGIALKHFVRPKIVHTENVIAN
jgi:hypothetical protein